MIKRILCFSNPAYLKLKLNQIVIEIPEVVYGKGVSDNMRQEGVRTVQKMPMYIFSGSSVCYHQRER